MTTNKHKIMKKSSLLVAFTIISGLSYAQNKAADSVAVAATSSSFSLSTTEILIAVLLVFTLILLFVSYTLLKGIKAVYTDIVKPKSVTETSEKKEKLSLMEKLLSLRPLSKEKDLEIPHEYDGIKELNNPIPAWFNWLFYGSVVFGFAYLYYYHIGEWGPRQDDEYKTELVAADAAKRKLMAASGSIDENSIKVDASQAEKGKTIYDANCAACHAPDGGGLVGPNLTDEFWLHGGSIKDIFKTIKYGVPDKGMVSWEKSMSAADIGAVSNYIVTLKGTKPATPKEPQGDKFEGDVAGDK